MSQEELGMLEPGVGRGRRQKEFPSKNSRGQREQAYVYVIDTISRSWLTLTVPLEK